MSDTQAMPAEMLARIFYKNDANGEPIRIASDGSTDGSVFLFTGNSAMGSDAGPTLADEGALSTDCYTRDAVTTVTGATAVLRDCPLTGAMTFLGEFLEGYKLQYDNLGNVVSIGVESPADANCLRWNTGAVGDTWTVIELAGWRDCDDIEESVRANVFRRVSQARPARNFQFGLNDPGSGTVDINLTLKQATANWGDGPGDHFAIYDDTGGLTLTRDPITLGFPVGTASLYNTLITLCACDNTVRGKPLTAALVQATTEIAGNELLYFTVV